MTRGELRVALAGLLALVTLVAFEALAVGTAMPVVATALHGLHAYGLAFSLFLTTSLLGMVLAGTWNDAGPPLRPIAAGLAAFTAGSLVCAVAPDFDVFLLGRALAGLGGGLIVVTLYVVVGVVFAPDARPRVFAWISSAWVLPSVVGPPVAGWLATGVTWRAVFGLVAPLAAVVAVVLLHQLRRVGLAARSGDAGDGGEPRPATRGAGRRRALLGLALAVGAAAAQSGAASAVPVRPLPIVLVAVGLALVVLTAPRLVPRGTLRLARGLPSVVAARGLFTACFTGAEAYVPLMLVRERGLTPTQAGLALTGAALGWAGGAVVQSRPGLRVARPRLMALAACLVALAVSLLVLPALHLVPGGLVLADWALGGFGMGLGLSSTSVLVLALAPAAERGQASSAMQLSDALGSVVGIGAAGAVVGAAGTAGRSHALAGVFAALAVVGLLAAVASVRIGAVPAVGGALDEPSADAPESPRPAAA